MTIREEQKIAWMLAVSAVTSAYREHHSRGYDWMASVIMQSRAFMPSDESEQVLAAAAVRYVKYQAGEKASAEGA